MEKTNGNDPINPSPEWVSTENREHGLTKREYFAAMAMQGIIAAWGQHDLTHFPDIAHDSVMAADAIITELNKTP